MVIVVASAAVAASNRIGTPGGQDKRRRVPGAVRLTDEGHCQLTFTRARNENRPSPVGQHQPRPTGPQDSSSAPAPSASALQCLRGHPQLGQLVGCDGDETGIEAFCGDRGEDNHNFDISRDQSRIGAVRPGPRVHQGTRRAGTIGCIIRILLLSVDTTIDRNHIATERFAAHRSPSRESVSESPTACLSSEGSHRSTPLAKQSWCQKRRTGRHPARAGTCSNDDLSRALAEQYERAKIKTHHPLSSSATERPPVPAGAGPPPAGNSIAPYPDLSPPRRSAGRRSRRSLPFRVRSSGARRRPRRSRPRRGSGCHRRR